MKEIINLTYHNINIITEKGNIVIKPSNIVPRINQKLKPIEYVNFNGIDVEINQTNLSEINFMPEEKENVYYIVSFPLALTCKDRKDFLFPNGLVRNQAGEVIGCSYLSKLN